MTLLSRRRKLILVLGNGAAGAEKQALALASKVQAYLPTEENVSVAMSRVPYSSRFFARLPPIAHVLFARSTNNPWIGYAHPLPNEAPDIVIGCGRSTVALCAGLKQAFPQVFNIQIQHPRTFLYHFDAIITPQHDFPSCPPPQNVYLTPGTICDISPKSLASARQQWRHSVEESWASYPHRKIAVLIGGSCRGYSLTLERAQHLVQHLQKVGATAPITLLVTFSRRTPHDVAAFLHHELPLKFSSSYIWDGHGENPFMGFLSHADAIITTPDSISMTTEAIVTGKPTFVFDMAQCKGKFKAFHEHLKSNHLAAPLDDLDAMALGNTISYASRQETMDAGVVPALVDAMSRRWTQLTL